MVFFAPPRNTIATGTMVDRRKARPQQRIIARIDKQHGRT
jgi:hypothetical protein